MNERSDLRMQLAASMVGSLVGPLPASPEDIESKMLTALGLADQLMAKQDVQNQLDRVARATVIAGN